MLNINVYYTKWIINEHYTDCVSRGMVHDMVVRIMNVNVYIV